MNTIAQILTHTTTDLSFQRSCYEDLHQHPELSGLERNTANRIEAHLSRFDCEIITGIGGYGIVAIFRNGEGPTALMRADFDALPVREDTGVTYASTKVHTHPDGSSTPVMHACGHDLHTTALLGVCALLDHEREQWRGTFIALFQPSEENGAGANAMIADGLAERIPHPDVAFGQHVMPGRAGQVQTMPGAIMSACDSIRIQITGISAHGSMPHNAVDPTFVAAMIIIRLQGIIGREVDPAEFAVISVGTLRSGNTNNIIPATAELVLNCRFFDDAVKHRVYQSIQRIVTAECEASGCPVPPTFDYFGHGEATCNSPEVFATVRPQFDAVFGSNSVTAQRSTVSEDFSHIPRALGVPYLFWLVGCTPAPLWDEAVAASTVARDVPVNHMPTFLPDYEPTITAATRAGATAVLTYLRAESLPKSPHQDT